MNLLSAFQKERRHDIAKNIKKGTQLLKSLAGLLGVIHDKVLKYVILCFKNEISIESSVDEVSCKRVSNKSEL